MGKTVMMSVIGDNARIGFDREERSAGLKCGENQRLKRWISKGSLQHKCTAAAPVLGTLKMCYSQAVISASALEV